MNIRQHIELEAVVHKKSIPSDLSKDMYEKDLDKIPQDYLYYSNSKGDLVNIFDMPLHHFIRAFAKISSLYEKDIELANNSKNDTLSKIKKILEVA